MQYGALNMPCSRAITTSIPFGNQEHPDIEIKADYSNNNQVIKLDSFFSSNHSSDGLLGASAMMLLLAKLWAYSGHVS